MQEYLQTIIVEAGKLAKEYFEAGVSHRTKSNLGDLVTDADIAVNNYLVKMIQEKYPDHAIHTEENKEDINPGAEYEWVIDPIDGTRNFAVGISFWCNMIAILKNGELMMSAIYHPIANELFFAEKGKGTTMNGEPVHVNTVNSLNFGFGICSRGEHTTFDAEFKRMISRLATDTTCWMHNYGTMLPCCYVATGGADFYAGNPGFDHDYLPVALICSEAGALVTDCEGNPWQRGRRDIVIANPALHPKILELLK